MTCPRIIDLNCSFRNSSNVMSFSTFGILRWIFEVRKSNEVRYRNYSNTYPTIETSFSPTCTAKSSIWSSPLIRPLSLLSIFPCIVRRVAFTDASLLQTCSVQFHRPQIQSATSSIPKKTNQSWKQPGPTSKLSTNSSSDSSNPKISTSQPQNPTSTQNSSCKYTPASECG